MNNGPVIIVAPFSPIGSCENPHLGAANKITAVMRILSRSGRRLIMVNSAHNMCKFQWPSVRRQTFDGTAVSACITPLTLPSRPWGKLVNLGQASDLAKRLATEKPALVWIYNSYAFEAQLALSIRARWECPIVLELEDWPTARQRGLSQLKPLLDTSYLHRLIPKVDLVACVNETMTHAPLLATKKTMLLPSLLHPLLQQQPDARAPFSGPERILGYFGGLNDEKGADVLLNLLPSLPAHWRLIVTGSGPLEGRFLAATTQYPAKLSFHPNAPTETLYRLMHQCDAIVNPHRPIQDMGDGIFPFKVFEAISTGRLVISSTLPNSGLDLKSSLLFFDGTAQGLLRGLDEAELYFKATARARESLVMDVQSKYTDQAVFDKLKLYLPCLSIGSASTQPSTNSELPYP